MANAGARLAVVIPLIFLVGCDHATKGFAKRELDGGAVFDLVSGVVDLRYVENTDVAFNLLRWVPEGIRMPGLLVLGAVAVATLGVLLFRARSQPRLLRFALLLVTAGAVGNYLDRVLRGYVVDFVHVHYWPVFNVADVYVTLGYALLALGFFCLRRGDPNAPARAGPE
jgi:signal peptidase II